MQLNYHVEHFAEDVKPCCVGLSHQNRSGCSAMATQPHSRAEKLGTSPIPFPREEGNSCIYTTVAPTGVPTLERLCSTINSACKIPDKNTTLKILPQAFEI